MRHGRKHVRGHFSIILGVSLLALFGFSALGLDAGWHRVGLTQLHNAADAGAHAGALALDGSREGLLTAVRRAHALATANRVHGQYVALSSDFTADGSGHPNNPDILVGRFDSPGEHGCAEEAGCWTPIGARPSETNSYEADAPDRDTAVSAATANAVHVRADGSVGTLFGGVAFGTERLAIANVATARRPLADGVRCQFPLTLPQCSIDELGPAACGQLIRLQLSSSAEDNAALSTPVGTSGSAAMREMIATDEGLCEHRLGEDTLVDGIADTVLNNGELSSVTSVLADQLSGQSPSPVDLDGDGMSDATYDYADNVQVWDPAWGPCPATVAEACDADKRGICKGGGTDPAAYVDATSCATAGGTWQSTCPDAPPTCDAPAGFVRRQVAVFDSAAYGMPCDGTNGNPVTGGSFNWNEPVDTSQVATLIIYHVGDSSPTVIDAYITCTDAQGQPHEDRDLDGVPDALHDGEELFVDLPGADAQLVQ